MAYMACMGLLESVEASLDTHGYIDKASVSQLGQSAGIDSTR